MIKNIALNTDNFLRFYPPSAPTLSTSQYYNGVVNGYEYRWRTFDTPLPIIVGDTFHFYTNFESSLFDESTQSVRVAEGTSVINDSSKYQISTTQIGLENWLITLTIPQTNTSEKVFSLAIVNNSDSAVIYKSNCFKVLKATEKNINNTHLISFRHRTSVFNYEWGALDPSDPDYTVRIPSSVLEFSYPKEDSVYKSATSGRPRKTRTILSKAYQFETYYLSEEAHDAINLAVNYDNFYINGDEFIADGAYEVEFQQLTNIHKGTINLLLKRYGARINNCVTPPPSPTPPVMNLLLIEVDETTGLQVDMNISPSVNSTPLTPLFWNNETRIVNLENNDLVDILYNHQGGFYDSSVTSADVQIVIEENGTEVINVTTPIPDLDEDFSRTESFTAVNDTVYDIVVRIIVTGTT